MSICMPFGLSQLRNRHCGFSNWTLLCMRVCGLHLCVFFKRTRGENIFVCILCPQSNPLPMCPILNKLSPAVTLTSGLPAADNKWRAHPAGPQLPKKHFYTRSQEECDVHTPTHTATQARTHSAKAGAGAGAGGVCCVTVGSSGRKHPPDLSNCQLRAAAGGDEVEMRDLYVNCVVGQVTFRSEHMSLMISGFQHIFFLSREDLFTVRQTSCVATLCGNVTMHKSLITTNLYSPPLIWMSNSYIIKQSNQITCTVAHREHFCLGNDSVYFFFGFSISIDPKVALIMSYYGWGTCSCWNQKSSDLFSHSSLTAACLLTTFYILEVWLQLYSETFLEQ